jgi:methionyl-tRNA formyltransferase
VLLVADEPAIAVPAEACARRFFETLWVSRHSRSDCRVPAELVLLVQSARPDYLFSLLSPVILPQAVLAAVSLGSVNFHPAPPEYPGVGACSYALYDEQKTFGVTAHMMESRVDAGAILAVKRFAIPEGQGCDGLSAQARAASLDQYCDVLRRIATEGVPPPSGDTWAGRARTSPEFLEWITLDPNCEPAHMERMIRAVRRPDLPGPFVVINGRRFGYLPSTDDQGE